MNLLPSAALPVDTPIGESVLSLPTAASPSPAGRAGLLTGTAVFPALLEESVGQIAPPSDAALVASPQESRGREGGLRDAIQVKETRSNLSEVAPASSTRSPLASGGNSLPESGNPLPIASRLIAGSNALRKVEALPQSALQTLLPADRPTANLTEKISEQTLPETLPPIEFHASEIDPAGYFLTVKAEQPAPLPSPIAPTETDVKDKGAPTSPPALQVAPSGFDNTSFDASSKAGINAGSQVSQLDTKEAQPLTLPVGTAGLEGAVIEGARELAAEGPGEKAPIAAPTQSAKQTQPLDDGGSELLHPRPEAVNTAPAESAPAKPSGVVQTDPLPPETGDRLLNLKTLDARVAPVKPVATAEVSRVIDPVKDLPTAAIKDTREVSRVVDGAAPKPHVTVANGARGGGMEQPLTAALPEEITPQTPLKTGQQEPVTSPAREPQVDRQSLTTQTKAMPQKAVLQSPLERPEVDGPKVRDSAPLNTSSASPAPTQSPAQVPLRTSTETEQNSAPIRTVPIAQVDETPTKTPVSKLSVRAGKTEIKQYVEGRGGRIPAKPIDVQQTLPPQQPSKAVETGDVSVKRPVAKAMPKEVSRPLAATAIPAQSAPVEKATAEPVSATQAASTMSEPRAQADQVKPLPTPTQNPTEAPSPVTIQHEIQPHKEVLNHSLNQSVVEVGKTIAPTPPDIEAPLNEPVKELAKDLGSQLGREPVETKAEPVRGAAKSIELTQAQTPAVQTATTPAAQSAVISTPPLTTQPTAFASTGQVVAQTVETRSAQRIEDAVDTLLEARDAGRTARSDLSLRHSEFGTVRMQIETAGADLRATLTSREAGFVPAVQAALADRAVVASSEATSGQFNRGQDQSQGQQGQNPSSNNSPFAGSSNGSERNYGSSTGSGQTSSQPYSDQMEGEEETRNSRGRNSPSRGEGKQGGDAGLFA